MQQYIAMRLKNEDIYKLIRACELYQENTGSEWMWEQYSKLIDKLLLYQDQHLTADGE